MGDDEMMVIKEPDLATAENCQPMAGLSMSSLNICWLNIGGNDSHSYQLVGMLESSIGMPISLSVSHNNPKQWLVVGDDYLLLTTPLLIILSPSIP